MILNLEDFKIIYNKYEYLINKIKINLKYFIFKKICILFIM